LGLPLGQPDPNLRVLVAEAEKTAHAVGSDRSAHAQLLEAAVLAAGRLGGPDASNQVSVESNRPTA
jgi:hypothetical protein